MAEPSTPAELDSWAPGKTLDAIVAFLDASASLAVEDRIAVFDNDGTLWCERPAYVQQAFIASTLEQRATSDPSYEIPELASTVMSKGMSAAGGVSLGELAAAINDVFVGQTPEEFYDQARQFAESYVNPHLGRTPLELLYQPMLELIAALRRREFDVFIVSGGGAAFVQAVSEQAYGVPRDHVIGTLVDYELDAATQTLRRTAALVGPPNEGFEKVRRIQQLIGRRPAFAAGNSSGDGDMLTYALGGDGPSLAVLVDHDDDAREIGYESVAATFDDAEPLRNVAERSGWNVVSMRDDWTTVFADGAPR